MTQQYNLKAKPLQPTQPPQLIDLETPTQSTASTPATSGKSSAVQKLTNQAQNEAHENVASFFSTAGLPPTPQKGHKNIEFDEENPGNPDKPRTPYQSRMYQEPTPLEDPQEIKERLMKLVSKGQREAELEEELRKKSALKRKKQIQVDDSDMHEKKFLQEAQNTINTQLERPSVLEIKDEFLFMAIDIDFFIDKPPGKILILQIIQ
ncbi:hypothetical protein FGO68_gene3113 [Halteria grandinella]|uniref:Uncharacterized protein n=1 Tax=Halteria grandinella TaxID=5974 RepID=A0A8J8T903_HALGN|nr:hypothetical protein FGO68_gene3113 [Halteria grandinella]